MRNSNASGGAMPEGGQIVHAAVVDIVGSQDSEVEGARQELVLVHPSRPLDAGQPDWADIDWDMTGDDGKTLRALTSLYRQIVAVEFGLCGHFPGENADLSAVEADGIAARLQAEAATFKRR